MQEWWRFRRGCVLFKQVLSDSQATLYRRNTNSSYQGFKLQKGLPDIKKSLWFGYVAVSSRIGCISDFTSDNLMLHSMNTENLEGVVHKELTTIENWQRHSYTAQTVILMKWTKMKAPFTFSILFLIENIHVNYFFKNHCYDSETLFTQRSHSSWRFQYKSLFSTVSTLFNHSNYNFQSIE